MEKHISHNNLNENMQSAYRPNHVTETVLVTIHDDIHSVLDNKYGKILVMRDVSAAFDTINHDILLGRLKCRVGSDGTASVSPQPLTENCS